VFIASGGHANGLDPAILKALGMLRRKSEARTILKESPGELPQHAQRVKAGGLFGGANFSTDLLEATNPAGKRLAGRGSRYAVILEHGFASGVLQSRQAVAPGSGRPWERGHSRKFPRPA